jgi:hypothetical protein
MSFWKFLYWTVFKKIRKIRPFWYIDYSKENAREFLEKEYNWEYYGGHHLENRMTAFHHSYYTPNKFGLDQRNNSLCASLRNKKITRDEAIKIYASKPHIEEDLLSYFKKRMNYSDKEFDEIMKRPKKNFTNYKTYKKRFELFRPLFAVLAKSNLVPMSFYLKFCFPSKNNKQ